MGEAVEARAGRRASSTPLRLDQIQGNIAPGFRKDHQAFLLLRFPSGPSGRRWLGAVAPDVASAEEVAAFDRLFKLLRRRRADQEARFGRATWINVALSWAGLRALGAPALDAFPPEFRHAGFDWSAGGDGGPAAADEVHALLIVAADRAGDLEHELAHQRAALADARVVELATYRGQTLPDALRGREHFGFRDGIGQPRIEGLDDDRPGPRVRPGEFVLGYPDQSGQPADGGPAWARDGSYLVFWRLRQHVAAFRQAIRREAAGLGLSHEQLAAKLIGRWPSGALPSDPIQPRDPGLGEDGRLDPSAADFRADPGGRRFPLFAHIRKANPRDLAPSVERHRLIRRGIPYGPPLAPERLTEDGQDRGLLFVSYQASIARQFEHVERHWLANGDFPTSGAGPDAFVGLASGACVVRLPEAGPGGRGAELRLPGFVSPTARGYFFAPSLDALAALAGRPAAPARVKEENQMLQSRESTDLVGSLRQIAESMQSSLRQMNEAVQVVRALVAGQLGPPRDSGVRGEPPADAGVVSRPEAATIDAGRYGRRKGGFRYRRFLREQNPYGAASIDPTGPIEAIGPASRSDRRDPFRRSLGELSPLEVDECQRWGFGDQTYRITKAIRVPYRYTHPQTGEKVEATILIGFQGPGY